MLHHERMEIILRQVQLQSTVKIPELSRMLHVSLDTVRRDLREMERAGLLKCIRGGACLPESYAMFSNFRGREVVHSDLKREASRKALRHIQPGDVVALNAGTTNAILAQEMAAHCRNITVVTNNLAAATALMQAEEIRLVVIGGEVDPREQATCGAICAKGFGRFYPDVTFLSIHAVNREDGFTDFRLAETEVIRFLARHSRQVMAVMDSSKLDKRSKCKVLELSDVTSLLMDGGVTEEARRTYRERGLRIE